MPQFHETMYGRIFFDSQLPTLLRTLKSISDFLQQNKQLQESSEVAKPYTVFLRASQAGAPTRIQKCVAASAEDAVKQVLALSPDAAASSRVVGVLSGNPEVCLWDDEGLRFDSGSAEAATLAPGAAPRATS